MSIHTKVLINNVAWLAAAVICVVVAFLATGSAKSLWAMAIYALGHESVERK